MSGTPDAAPAAEEEATVLEPAAVTRTSAELLNRPLPRVLSERPIRFIFGPAGVGKTSVARRIAGASALEIDAEGLRKAMLIVARQKVWPPGMEEAPALILDDVDSLFGRLGAIDIIGHLLERRALADLSTVVCQGEGDVSMHYLYGPIPHHLRATLLIRFPVGSGRRRYIKQRCLERGIDFVMAREAIVMEPWSYMGVERFLDGVLSRGK
jgi:hypothetical protein